MKIIDQMERAWPDLLVFRRDCEKASSGAITRKHLANLDSAGKGPEGKFTLNGKVAYPAEDFFQWLRTKVTE